MRWSFWIRSCITNLACWFILWGIWTCIWTWTWSRYEPWNKEFTGSGFIFVELQITYQRPPAMTIMFLVWLTSSFDGFLMWSKQFHRRNKHSSPSVECLHLRTIMKGDDENKQTRIQTLIPALIPKWTTRGTQNPAASLAQPIPPTAQSTGSYKLTSKQTA